MTVGHGGLAGAVARASLRVLRHLPPETAHDLGLAGLQWMRPLWTAPEIPATLAVSCAGLRFAHPLGLAAGFDKNGDYLDALGALGFSHIELRIGISNARPVQGCPPPLLRIRPYVASRLRSQLACLGYLGRQ
jgi:dihydroorotate dehydrogenase